jgi:hypothetical protein
VLREAQLNTLPAGFVGQVPRDVAVDTAMSPAFAVGSGMTPQSARNREPRFHRLFLKI